MSPEINPWSSQPSLEIEKTFSEFGISPIGNAISKLPEVPYFIRRGIVLGHRDYQVIAEAIHNRRQFHILTGFMPSGHPHLGHLMVMKEVVWHVRQGGNGYITIADREAHAVRGLPWEKCNEFGKEYLSCLYALGFEGQTYSQSKNDRLKDLAFEAATKVNFSELAAIYGFGADTDLAHADSVITQVADILYPQIDREPAPTLVPVGIDQDPHIRLTRGIAHKMRMFTVEERDGYISVRSKNAPEEALEAVRKAFPHAKKYAGACRYQGGAMHRCCRKGAGDRAGTRRVCLLHPLVHVPYLHAGPHWREDVLEHPGEHHLLLRARGHGEKEGDEWDHWRKDDPGRAETPWR